MKLKLNETKNKFSALSQFWVNVIDLFDKTEVKILVLHLL